MCHFHQLIQVSIPFFVEKSIFIIFHLLVYHLNLLLFMLTLSVHSKFCKVHLKITTVLGVITAEFEYDILKQI